MIAHITGELRDSDQHSVIIDVRDVGYRIFVGEGTLGELLDKGKSGNAVSLFTHLAVRENAHDLYGFIDKEELHFFELLISVSGIGPKSALAILNLAPVKTLREAVAANDDSYLTKVSGIGKKSARKIVLELQDKIGISTEGAEARAEDIDTLEALKVLGYSSREVRSVLRNIPKEVAGTNERVKEALKLLGGK